MSSGVFVISKYEDDEGDIYPVRVQPETIAGFNVPVGGETTVAGRLRLTTGRRQFGVSPRTISGVWDDSPPGYKTSGVVKMPILSPAVWDGISLGDSLTYLGGTFTVTGRNPEKSN